MDIQEAFALFASKPKEMKLAMAMWALHEIIQRDNADTRIAFNVCWVMDFDGHAFAEQGGFYKWPESQLREFVKRMIEVKV